MCLVSKLARKMIVTFMIITFMPNAEKSYGLYEKFLIVYINIYEYFFYWLN